MQQPIDGVNARPIQETIWILNSGVHNLTVGILTSAITIVSDTSLLILLPHHSAYVVRIAMDNTQYLAGDIRHTVISNKPHVCHWP